MKDYVIFRLEFSKHHLEIMHLFIGIGCIFIMAYFFVVLTRWRKEQRQAIQRTVEATEEALQEFKKQAIKLEKDVKAKEKKTVAIIQDFNSTHSQLRQDVALLKRVLQKMGVKNPNAPKYDPTKDMFSGE